MHWRIRNFNELKSSYTLQNQLLLYYISDFSITDNTVQILSSRLKLFNYFAG